MNLKVASDEILYQEWGKLITAAAQIKRELERRQNQPPLRMVQNSRLKINKQRLNR